MRTAGIKGKPRISAAASGARPAQGAPRMLCSAAAPPCRIWEFLGLQGTAQGLAVAPGLLPAPFCSRRQRGHGAVPRADSAQRMKVSTETLERSCWRDGSSSQQPFAPCFLHLLILTLSEPNQTQFLFSWGEKITELGQIQGKTQTRKGTSRDFSN